MIHTIFFDLDNTLYPRTSGIWEAIGSRMNLYMTDKLHISHREVLPLRRAFKREHGTTLRGLSHRFAIDEREFLDFVHDVDLPSMLEDDNRLFEMLSTISQRKIICTNSDVAHAIRVLKFLRVEEIFDSIIDIFAMKPFAKPQPGAYRIALEKAGLDDAADCMFIDDMLENVEGAQLAGFSVVHISENSNGFPTMNSIFELPTILEGIENIQIHER